MESDGGPAFPHDSIHQNPGGFPECESGMSLRDYFAGKAMQALVALQSGEKFYKGPIVEDAYKMADAMLRAREAKPQGFFILPVLFLVGFIWMAALVIQDMRGECHGHSDAAMKAGRKP